MRAGILIGKNGQADNGRVLVGWRWAQRGLSASWRQDAMTWVSDSAPSLQCPTSANFDGPWSTDQSKPGFWFRPHNTSSWPDLNKLLVPWGLSATPLLKIWLWLSNTLFECYTWILEVWRNWWLLSCVFVGGTLMNESITRAAGASYGQELPPERMEELIR